MERIGLAPGTEVGGYRILAPLGSGGMGAVYRAEDGGGNQVALKLLHPHVGADPAARERLRREVTALQRLRHPGVAAVVDAEADSTEAFIVTELVPGPDLATRVREEGPLDPVELAGLAERLHEVLAAVHAAGVVHRDLKPSNVLLGEDGPVLIDFGIAQGVDDARLTSTGLVLGTPGYLAPELLDGREPDAASDWWGWAAVLAFAASGRDPFGTRPLEAVLARVRDGDVDLAGVPGPVARVLRAALLADPAERIPPEAVVRGLAEAVDVIEEDEDPGPTAVLTPPAEAVEPTRVLVGEPPAALSPAFPAAAVSFDELLAEPEPEGYLPPVPPRRPVALALWALALAVVATLAPGVTLLGLAVLVVLFQAVDSGATALEERRVRRGGPGRGDAARAVLASPWHLLRGLVVALPSLVVGASVVVVVGGVVWWLLDSGRLDTRGAEEWAHHAAVAGAVLLGIVTTWGGPVSAGTRLGARRTLARLAPGRGGSLVLVTLALLVAGLALLLLATGSQTVWWPLPGPPSL